MLIHLQLDADSDGNYWAARHAVAVAIRHHQAALKQIERNREKAIRDRRMPTRANSQARESHEDAVEKLNDLMDLLVQSRVEAIEADVEHRRDRATDPRYGDQTTCEACGVDIEYHGPESGTGPWMDRGGNTTCNVGDDPDATPHRPVSDR